MLSLILRGLARAALVVLCATLVSFALLRLAPGDATDAAVEGFGLTHDQRRARAAALGLDQPLHVQLGRYATAIARADLGQSSSERRPVAAVLAESLPATALLSGCALVLAAALGIGIGTLHGWRPASRTARAAASLLTATYALPEVVLGVGLLAVFALRLRAFPAGGMGDPLVALTGTAAARWIDRAWHLVLPATALALAWSAGILRQQRNAIRGIAEQPFVRSARAKGLGPTRLVVRHVMRPSLAGTVALLGTMLPALVGGTVIVESLFAWPGMGLLLVRAVALRDAPLLAGAMVLVSSAVAVGSLCADMTVRLLDPRTRDGSAP